MKLLGLPMFGFWLPYIGKPHLPLNRDGSFADGESDDLHERVGYYYVKPLVVGWFGVSVPLTPSPVYLTATDEVVEPPWEDGKIVG